MNAFKEIQSQGFLQKSWTSLYLERFYLKTAMYVVFFEIVMYIFPFVAYVIKTTFWKYFLGQTSQSHYWKMIYLTMV